VRLSPILALAVLLVPARPADACHNAVERVIDPINQSVRRAEQLLADGAHQAAVRELARTFPELLRANHRDGRPALFRRAQRTAALAVVRSDGAVRLGPRLSGRTPEQRHTALAWAAAILRLHHARSGDLVVRVELAEALARRPAERAEARAILDELADLDLLPTARAWALLADLERERGDAAAEGRAARRCREIDASECPAAAPAA
jgi:hypothetical protein